MRTPIQHCKACGSPVLYRLPDDGDTKLRAVCTNCATVSYENPLNVVGTIATWGSAGEQVLLCKRNIEPRWGKWTLPAGFMELGETTLQGAQRETQEEAGAEFEMLNLFAMVNAVNAGQVHFFYRAKLLSPTFNPGPETLEAKLFGFADIPWDEIAFKTNLAALERYFADLHQGQFGVHTLDV